MEAVEPQLESDIPPGKATAAASSTLQGSAASETALNTAFSQFVGENTPAVLKATLKKLLPLVEALQRAPGDKKNRSFRLDNIGIKKIMEAKGSLSIFLSIGFQQVEQKGHQYLQIEPESISSSLLKAAIDLISSRLSESPEPPPVANRPKVLCVAGCGFYGDPDNGDLCSKCHKAKYFPSAANPAKPAAAAAAPEPAVLCTTGCGFFGSSKFKGLCGKCYNAAQKKIPSWKKKWARAAHRIRAVVRFKSFVKEILQKGADCNFCWKCKRRVGVDGIECRCRYIFCGAHRYCDQHDCPFDIKKRHRDLLARQNAKLAEDKFDRMAD